ncbi:hypothetical protein ED208_01795 [Stagnimonas aquatica]|uniref:Right handed beta helix domain-containing protein n=1 Tax=Stagnimonas aquatica TaxID=2689987 RepID=A0A3N0VKI2_9GAMM|nr:right-handed parallel beta-helix repeat-containing protein [Stagnimonas aquatica]ROH93283.1 hypothetical protein ED208_01795 [Stagnimonas aquatica]
MKKTPKHSLAPAIGALSLIRAAMNTPALQPLHHPARSAMTLKTHPLLRMTTAALLLAASSSALAQGSSSNMRFVYISSTAELQAAANELAKVGKGDVDGPATKANPYNVYLLAAGTYKVPLNLLEGRAVAALYGGFPPGFAGYTSFTDASFPGALATRDLKNNVTVLSGDLNNNGIVDDGDAASVVTLTSRLTATILDGFHIEGALESAVKVDGGRPVLRNLVIRGNAGHGLQITGGATSSIDNVLIHGNGGTGLVVEGATPSFTGLTIAGNGKASTAVGGLSCTGTGGNCGTYRNTIIWDNTGGAVAVSADSPAPNPTFHYSLVQGCKVGGTWNPACGIEGSNNLADADPRFVDAQFCTARPNRAGNYRLKTTSPALNLGDNTATTRPKDLDGLARVQASTIDLGAYEGGVVAPAVNGACGTANGAATSMAPTGCALCATGTATAVIGSNGAWGWVCNGSDGGSASPACAAPYASQTLSISVNPSSVAVGATATVTAESTSGLKPTLSRSSDSTAGCTVGTTSNTSTGVQATVSTQSAGACGLLANHPGTGDTGTARFLAAQRVSAILTVNAPTSACERYRSRAGANVIDLRSSPGGQTVRGEASKFNVIFGSAFADTITGGNAGNCIDGGAGNDRLTAGSGENYLYGGDGNDTLTPGSGSTAMDGGAGTDKCGLASSRATATYTSCESN